MPVEPAFAESDRQPFVQVMQIVALAPWAFVGFESISNSSRAFAFPTKRTVAIFAAALVTSVAAYSLLGYIAASVQPAGYSDWPAYIQALGDQNGLAALPTFFAAESTMGQTGTALLGATIAYAYASLAAFKNARTEENRLVQVTGIAGMLVSALLFLYFMIPNLWPITAMATESYLILIVWSILGFLVYRGILNGKSSGRFGRSPIVWIVLLTLIFSSSLIWMRQSTRDYTEDVLENLNNYNVAELAEHGIQMTETQKADAEYYLESQMTDVSDFLTRNSATQIILIVVALFIMFNIYNTITSQRQDLERQKLKAEESSKAKTTFLSNMSHDIRTPMNAILGYTALAQKEPDLPPQVEEYLVKIENSSQHLLSLINDVLEMSRIESGKLELDLADMDIVENVEDMRNMFQTQMDAKNIDFEVDVEQVEDRWVLCDKGRLGRVMLNLLSNAHKFTPEGGTIRMSLSQAGAKEGRGFYELRVKDSGIGMSAEFAEKVFESFERERTSTVSGIQGTGLGMAITKSIVTLMDGSIEAFTETGKGTEFVVRLQLPLVTPPAEAAELETPQQDEQQAFDFSGKKLLLPIEEIKEGNVGALPDKDRTLLLYCRTGRRAEDSAALLANLGYKNVYAIGGIFDWTGEVVTSSNAS